MAIGKLSSFIESHIGKGDRRTEKRKMTVGEARKILEESEAEAAISQEVVLKEAINAVEQDGIVFIDEIDKIVTSSGYRYGALKRECALFQTIQRCMRWVYNQHVDR